MNRRHAVALATVPVVLAVATLPLRWGLDGTAAAASGLSARGTTGTVWRGQARGAAIGSVRLGEVAIRLQPAALLGGRLQWRLEGDRLAASVRAGRHPGVIAANGELEIPGVPARLFLRDVDLAFDGRRCIAASGRLVADIGMAMPDADAGVASLQVEGPLECRDGRLRAVLAPSGPLPPGVESATLEAELDADAGLAVVTRIRSDLPAIRDALASNGFAPTATGPLVRSDRIALR